MIQQLTCYVCGSTLWHWPEPCEEQQSWAYRCRSCGHRRYFDIPLNKDDDGHVWVEEGIEP